MYLEVDGDSDVERDVVFSDVDDQFHLVLKSTFARISHRQALTSQVRGQQMSVRVSDEGKRERQDM